MNDEEYRVIDGKPVSPEILKEAEENVRKAMEKYKNIVHIVCKSDVHDGFHFDDLLVEKREMTTKEAVDHLTEELKSDDDYRRSWHANISMAFQDEYARGSNLSDNERMNIRDVANKAADNFLNLLCNEHHSKKTEY